MAFDLPADYKDVPARILDFKEKHPEGSLRPLNPDRPYDIVSIEGQTFIVVVAAAFRTPDDPAPGVGMAYELVPGRTPYTKLSELQNAETSAWGRAIVASLASESKSVASAEDVRNRRADHEAKPPRRVPAAKRPPQSPPGPLPVPEAVGAILAPLDTIVDEAERKRVKKLWVDEFGAPAGLDTGRYEEASNWVDGVMANLEVAK